MKENSKIPENNVSTCNKAAAYNQYTRVIRTLDSNTLSK